MKIAENWNDLLKILETSKYEKLIETANFVRDVLSQGKVSYNSPKIKIFAGLEEKVLNCKGETKCIQKKVKMQEEKGMNVFTLFLSDLDDKNVHVINSLAVAQTGEGRFFEHRNMKGQKVGKKYTFKIAHNKVSSFKEKEEFSK